MIGKYGNKTVTISANEYRYLLERNAILELYENAGVDNWSGADMIYESLKFDYPDLYTQTERMTQMDRDLDKKVERLLELMNWQE